MRHQMQKNSSFGRHRGPRKALIRGLVNSLVEKERIKTTVPKAKCIRPLIERAITTGKQANIHARRLLLSRYPNKKTVDKIMNILSPRFKDRQGGYTRIIKLGFRSGDQAPLAYLEFVDYNVHTISSPVKKENTKKRKEEKDKKEEVKAKTDISKKEEKTKVQKNTKTAKKTSSTKLSDSKKQKKQAAVKIDKKRKKARQQQQKSRRINR